MFENNDYPVILLRGDYVWIHHRFNQVTHEKVFFIKDLLPPNRTIMSFALLRSS